MSFYPRPDSYSKNKIKVELDLSDYANKSEVKKGTVFYISEFSKEFDLFCLK